jgi:hypothetical protein
MIVKCDTFDYRGDPEAPCCYPVYVTSDENVREIERANQDTTREVYSMALTDDEQLAERFSFHFDWKHGESE